MDKTSTYEEISSQRLRELLNDQNFTGVVVFTTDWMGGSALLHTMMEKMARNFSPDIRFFFIDSEKASDLSYELGINGHLTTLLFKNGSIIERLRGVPSKILLKTKIEHLQA